MASMLLKGGRIIDPLSGLDETGDVAIADGRVAAIGGRLSDRPADATLDCEGLIVCPGLIDPHVHLREPGQTHKESIETGTRCAVRGGFTAVVCMPNTSPAIDTPEVVSQVLQSGARRGRCRVFTSAAATVGRKGATLTDFAALAGAGAVAFTDDGDVIADRGMMENALRAALSVDAPLMQHCQDPALTVGASMHRGAVSARLGLVGWPREAEESIVERDIALNGSIGARYHVQHISSGGTVELIRRARADGSPVTGEASPHHLTLTDEACAGFDTNAKMNPPLREASDVRGLRQGVADGVITVLGTDHAPHTAEEKEAPFARAPFGIIGLETALGLYAEALVASGAVSWPRLVALLTVEPARLCNLDRMGLGSLSVGGPADVTVLDPGLAWTIDPEDTASRSRNTPFGGRRVVGRAVRTIVGGELRWSLADA